MDKHPITQDMENAVEKIRNSESHFIEGLTGIKVSPELLERMKREATVFGGSTAFVKDGIEVLMPQTMYTQDFGSYRTHTRKTRADKRIMLKWARTQLKG